MKKFISLAICLLLVFALSVPSFAAAGEDLTVDSNNATISGNVEYNNVYNNYKYSLTVDRNACLKAQKIAPKSYLNKASPITVKSGATVTTAYLSTETKTLTIESGATVIIGEGFDSGYLNTYSLDLTGTLRGTLTKGTIIPATNSDIYTIRPGGLFDVTFEESSVADRYASALSAYNVNRIGNRVIAHYGEHNYENGVCTICYHECDNGFHADECPECGMIRNDTPAVGSALSEGNMAIIIGIVALVIGLGGGFFIGRKKKPAVAGGADNNDEE